MKQLLKKESFTSSSPNYYEAEVDEEHTTGKRIFEW